MSLSYVMSNHTDSRIRIADNMNVQKSADIQSLHKLITSICNMQLAYSSENTADMQLRGNLVRNESKKVLLDLLSSKSGFDVVGSDGRGRKARIPWIRIFNGNLSPKPTQGYYIVYLFAADGKSVVLSLNQGTTNTVGGSFYAKPEHEVRERRDKARSIIGPQIDQQVETSFGLSDDGPLAQGYIAGNIYSKTYQLDRLPDNSTLSADLSTFINWLSTLYERQNQVEPLNQFPLVAGDDTQKPTFDEIATEFGLHLSDCHLEFTPTVVTRLLTSLLSKRFLILTGLSGSGKTKLAVALAQWLTPNCYQVIPVGADWTGNENVMGYPDGLNHQQFNTTPILDLVLEAVGNPKQPYLLILDEMNLSHVERYFSDILSCIESDESLTLYSGTLTERSTWRKSLSGASIPPQLAAFPPNLFIIGTVNIDETTYMFSPKVLDRAHVIEFRVSNAQIKQFLDNPQKPNMSVLRGKGTKYGQSFVTRSQSAIECSQTLQQTLQSELLTFFKCLSTVGAEFGFRTALEMVRFVSFYIELNESTLTTITQPIDFVVLQKLLPKLHGSRTKLAPVLKQLWYLCITPIDQRELNHDDGTMPRSSQSSSQADPSSAIPANAPYPASAEKIARMWKLLHANGFTSFAEA